MATKTTADRRPTTEDRRRPTGNGPRSAVFGLRSILRAAAALVLATMLVSVALAVDGDVTFKRKGGEGGTPPAMFPHWIHRIRYKCYACHPGLFEMKSGGSTVSMDLIQQGKSCGVCHNDQTAWAASFETCARCHPGS